MTRLASALLCAALLGASAAAEPALDGAGSRIESFYAALRECMKQCGPLDAGARKAKVGPAVDATYDLPFMAEKVLGRHWKELPQDQQARWVETFSRLTVSTYAARFSEDKGTRLVVGTVEPANHGTAIVHTQIVPANDEPVNVHYRMRPDGDGWRVVDVYLNGKVSELALRRSEYTTVIERDGFESLVKRLDEKITRGETI
jgi:phospholipid transport system substrate-binding protein